jgi:hypothetical protein
MRSPRFLDALLGRTKPVEPNLDVLFEVPSAAYTLQAALGMAPTGKGGVCFKSAEGGAAEAARDELQALLEADDSARTSITDDEYGFTWVTCQRADADLSALVTQLHAVNSVLADARFGPTLLCTVIAFSAQGPTTPLGLVYLFKRGTFYPFAPSRANQRDNALELRIRATLAEELPIEPELDRWFALWSAPVP